MAENYQQNRENRNSHRVSNDTASATVELFLRIMVKSGTKHAGTLSFTRGSKKRQFYDNLFVYINN